MGQRRHLNESVTVSGRGRNLSPNQLVGVRSHDPNLSSARQIAARQNSAMYTRHKAAANHSLSLTMMDGILSAVSRECQGCQSDRLISLEIQSKQALKREEGVRHDVVHFAA